MEMIVLESERERQKDRLLPMDCFNNNYEPKSALDGDEIKKG